MMNMNNQMATQQQGNKQNTLAETIQKIQQQITVIGLGPHTPKQKEELEKMNLLLTRAKQEHNSRMLGKSTGHADVSSGMSSTPQLASLTASPAMMHTAGASAGSSSGQNSSAILDKKRLQDLVKEVDPLEQLDDDVEEVLLQLADDFIDNVVNSACHLAKHRKANTVEAKDVQLHLEHNWNMWIPGFGSEDLKPYKKSATTEAHKQRMALIRKTMKKY